MARFLNIIFIIILFFGCQKSPDFVIIETDYGSFTIEVDYNSAPKHSENFVKLVKEGFYNGLFFHRIVPGTLVQGGDPYSKDEDPYNDGLGGPGYLIDQEIKLRHIPGAVGAARIKGPANPELKSNGSQFYICLDQIPLYDGAYTVFGKVVENLEILEKISWEPVDFNDKPKKPILIKRAYLKE